MAADKRVVIIGTTGNIGTAALGALAAESAISSLVGVARRLPHAEVDKTTWLAADVNTAENTSDDSTPKRGASISLVRYGVSGQATTQK